MQIYLYEHFICKKAIIPNIVSAMNFIKKSTCILYIEVMKLLIIFFLLEVKKI